MNRVKLIALIAGALAITECKLDAKGNSQALVNAKQAQAVFEQVQVGGDGWETVQKLNEIDPKSELMTQVSIPTNAGTAEWTTIRYRLVDGSYLYVTYDGVDVVSKQRML
jgi:hypothetical protein